LNSMAHSAKGHSKRVVAGTAGALAVATLAKSGTTFSVAAAPRGRFTPAGFGTNSGTAHEIRTDPATGSAAGCAVAVTGVMLTAAIGTRRRIQTGRPGASSVSRHVATVDAPAATERPDLTGMLPDCPATMWKAEDIDIASLPEVAETAPLIIDAAELGDAVTKGAEVEYFKTRRQEIMEQLQKHGAIWLRNFEMTKDAEGFRAMYEALQLNPCLDPIHTSGLREMVGKKDAVYEAVNKPSLAQHFVGLHNESTYVKTAKFGAFVCFKPASEGGGEFLVADGAKIINDMDKDVLKRLYENKVRISVSNLDVGIIINALPEFAKTGAANTLQDVILKTVAPKFDMDLEMIYGADGTNPYRLQAIEHAQSPINRHPETGQPVWFCNLHNHSRYLRDRRPCTVPEVGMTDVYSGDLSKIDPKDVQHINEVCEKNIVSMMMREGDVMLLDNYRVLHGRDIFKGERNHAVTWFASCGEPSEQTKESREKPDDFMNNLINKTLL